MYLGCLGSKLSNNRVSCGSSGLVSGTASALVCIHRLQALFLGNTSYPSLPEFRSAMSLCIWVPEPQIIMVANLGRKWNSLALSSHMNNVKTKDKNTAWYNSRVNKKCARQNIKPCCSGFFSSACSLFTLLSLLLFSTSNPELLLKNFFLLLNGVQLSGVLFICMWSLGCLLRFGYIFIELGMNSDILGHSGFFLRLAQWYLSQKHCVVTTVLYHTHFLRSVLYW